MFLLPMDDVLDCRTCVYLTCSQGSDLSRMFTSDEKLTNCIEEFAVVVQSRFAKMSPGRHLVRGGIPAGLRTFPLWEL